MAQDLATLSIAVDNGDVVKAETSLNSLTVAGTKTEAATQRLTRRMALLQIEAQKVDAEMTRNATALGRFHSAVGRAETAVPGLTHALEALSVAAAIGFIGHKTIEETELAQAAMAQLEAAVTATGGAAGRTVEQLDALSIALQKQTTYSDEAVKGAEAILLTFNKIKGTDARPRDRGGDGPRDAHGPRSAQRRRCRSGRRCRTPSKDCRHSRARRAVLRVAERRRSGTSSIRAAPPKRADHPREA
jgi:hypothetical protein